ncbi:unnamed protein product [Caenorhabditis angaria]|uniref:BAR domain-containing protein n=1 Tax=Caenorhabditis angaria TaxID=860376 RepID=A0A9P1IKA5_9PELO|nr:unnamed protein product [Caenorhabditis angaria]
MESSQRGGGSIRSKLEESTYSSQNATKFHGIVGEANKKPGLLTSLRRTKRKSRKIPDEINQSIQQLDAYKSSADKMHKALIYQLFENYKYAKIFYKSTDIPKSIQMDRPYKAIGDYLGTFEKCTKKSRKGKYLGMDKSTEALKELSNENDEYVKKQLENLKPLISFIGQEYWEHAKLRNAYFESLDAYENAQNAQNRGKSGEMDLTSATKNRDENKAKLSENLSKLWDEQRPKHAECLLKFAEDAAKHHEKMAEILATTDCGLKSMISLMKS